MSLSTPTPRTDGEITFTGTYINTELTTLTTERDQLRADCEKAKKQFEILNETLQHVTSMYDTATTRAERAEAELADQAARFHDEIVRRQGTVRNNHELNLKERDHLLDLLRIEWARLGKMRTLLTASNAKLALIFGELTAGESRTIRAVLKYVLSIH